MVVRINYCLYITEPVRKKIAQSDSDEDDFLDRTGDIERRRQRKADATSSVALSHTELLDQEKKLLESLDEINSKIQQYQDNERRKNDNKDEDDLDAYMKNLSNEKKVDKTEVRRLRVSFSC